MSGYVYLRNCPDLLGENTVALSFEEGGFTDLNIRIGKDFMQK